VHFAVDGGDVVRRGAGVVKNGGSVVIQAGSAAFEEAGDDDERVFTNEFAKRGCGGTGEGFGDGEERVVFALAKVLRAEELRQADELGADLWASRTRATALARLASVEGSQDI